MLKLRQQGKRDDFNRFSDWLEHQPGIEVIQSSDIFSNKGTNQYYRMYVEIQKVEKMEAKSSPRRELGFCFAKQGGLENE